MRRSLIPAFLALAMLCSVALAADLEKMTDQFHAGLADIIEANMDNPDECLRLVEQYYQSNQALIAQIREATKKALEQAAPMMQEIMDASMSMDEKKLQSLEKKYEGMQRNMPQKDTSTGLTRYNRLFEQFIQKHPQRGMQIGMKALALVPPLDTSGFSPKQE